MGLFEEQIRQRKEHDQTMFEDALFDMASAVLGKEGGNVRKDRHTVTREAIDDILNYYHFRAASVPDHITDQEEQLEYALQPHGMMYRHLTLSENWHRDSFGPLLVFMKEDGMPQVLYPRLLRGYYWQNADGKRTVVTAKNRSLFEEDAICFYKPLPMKEIGIQDLILYMKDCLNLGDYFLLAALTLAVTLTGMMMPRITRLLTGFVLESGSVSVLWSTTVFLVCVLLSMQLFSISRELAVFRILLKTSVPVESAMMMRLISLPSSFFRQYSSGELASRSSSISELCELLVGIVFSMGITAAASLLYLRQIAFYAPALTVVTLLVVAAILIIMMMTIAYQIRVNRVQMVSASKETGMAYNLISNVQKIRLAGAEKRAFAKWAGAYAESAGPEYNPPAFLKVSPAIRTAVPLLGLIAIYYFSVQSGVEPSEYMAFNAAYGILTGAVVQFADQAVSIARIRPIFEMAEPILMTRPEMAEQRDMVTDLRGSIALSGVSFRYNDSMPYVIDDISLQIRPGEYVGLVGTTGCGKSTLIRLMLGFETPERGAVYYDGRDLNSLDLHSLRRRLGTVTQDGELFLGDIYSNITVSAPSATMEDAWKAAELAGLAEDIRALPMGMKTIIGEGRGGLSSGQKQRLMIARAVAANPKILLFDEATSSLDNRTQQNIKEALDTLDCTRIIVAHRLSTIRNCDRILVMDRGRIVEEGTYSELIEKNGLFAQLVENQRMDT